MNTNQNFTAESLQINNIHFLQLVNIIVLNNNISMK